MPFLPRITYLSLSGHVDISRGWYKALPSSRSFRPRYAKDAGPSLGGCVQNGTLSISARPRCARPAPAHTPSGVARRQGWVCYILESHDEYMAGYPGHL